MKIGAPVSVGKYIAHSMIPVFIGNTIAGLQPISPLLSRKEERSVR